MAISLKINPSELEKLGDVFSTLGADVQSRAVESASLLRSNIINRGRADIAASGNFGARWLDGFLVDVIITGPNSVIVRGRMDVSAPYWPVFQYGATIQGKPWLWFAPKPGTVKSSQGFTMNPKVIKKAQVVIPKKFHLYEIIEEETAQLGLNLVASTIEGDPNAG